MQNVFVPVDGLVFHRNRDCAAIKGRRVDAISTWSPRAHLFDPCHRCVPGATRRELPAVSLRAVEEMPAWRLESMRAEAARRHVTLLDWLARHPAVDASEIVTS
jgi:hypothetical protein